MPWGIFTYFHMSARVYQLFVSLRFYFFRKICYDNINRFRLAEQGIQSKPILVLGLIVCLLIGVIRDWLQSINLHHEGDMPMKTKMKNVLALVNNAMVEPVGLEPTTISVQARRSVQLELRPQIMCSQIVRGYLRTDGF